LITSPNVVKFETKFLLS